MFVYFVFVVVGLLLSCTYNHYKYIDIRIYPLQKKCMYNYFIGDVTIQEHKKYVLKL